LNGNAKDQASHKGKGIGFPSDGFFFHASKGRVVILQSCSVA
jgi:hypothetical protein